MPDTNDTTNANTGSNVTSICVYTHAACRSLPPSIYLCFLGLARPRLAGGGDFLALGGCD